MNKQQAIRLLIDFISTVDDDELRAAVAALVADAPPTPVGAAWNEAAALAEQIAKTGQAGGWATPPAHSEAMERLLHRLIVLLEVMVKLFEETYTMESNAS